MNEEAQSPYTEEEIQELEQKREAYARAVEGGGISGAAQRVIRMIRGGKPSGDAELTTILDAELEDQLRDEVKNSHEWVREIPQKKLEKYQKSFLKFKKTSDTATISGVINGQKVEVSWPYWHSSKDGFLYWNIDEATGTINGEPITTEDAEAIAKEYENIARTQGGLLKNHIDGIKEKQKSDERQRMRHLEIAKEKEEEEARTAKEEAEKIEKERAREDSAKLMQKLGE